MQPDDPDDPLRTVMRQMVGVFAELERRTVAKRLSGAADGRPSWAPSRMACQPSASVLKTVSWSLTKTSW